MVKNKRIGLLSDLCKGYDTVLDIGTDHGLILLEAFKKGHIKKAIASDLREMPLKQAYKNLKNYPVTFVLSDGFLAIKESFDLAIISGMGAYLIGEILDHAPNSNITYVLQPNDKYEDFRRYLTNHGFRIKDEFLIFEKHFYIVILADRKKEILSEEDIILGPKLRFKKEAMDYYHYKINQLERIIHQVDEKRKLEILYIRDIYKEGLNRLIVS
jgi:tRNA (adenine22-N1)-methyltransferase